VAAGAAGAHQSSALHGYGALFSVVSLPTEPVGCEKLTKGGSSTDRGRGLQSRTCGSKVQASTFGDGGGRSTGQLTTRLGKMGVAKDVEHRRRVDGAREASHAAW
jgi:hypothetical protein